MRKVILSTEKKFEKEEEWAKKPLNQLDRTLKLKGKYLEVYLIRGDFNVHSFPASQNFPRPDLKGYKNLGEIYLCPNRIKNKEEFVFMLVHGLLHLLGYDHKKKGDRIRMEKKEHELCRLLV